MGSIHSTHSLHPMENQRPPGPFQPGQPLADSLHIRRHKEQRTQAKCHTGNVGSKWQLMAIVFSSIFKDVMAHIQQNSTFITENLNLLQQTYDQITKENLYQELSSVYMGPSYTSIVTQCFVL